jgi:hypothetical protein
MFYGIFHQCLDHHWRYLNVHGFVLQFNFEIQPFFKADFFKVQVIVNGFEFFTEGDGSSSVREQ